MNDVRYVVKCGRCFLRGFEVDKRLFRGKIHLVKSSSEAMFFNYERAHLLVAFLSVVLTRDNFTVVPLEEVDHDV